MIRSSSGKSLVKVFVSEADYGVAVELGVWYSSGNLSSAPQGGDAQAKAAKGYDAPSHKGLGNETSSF